MKYDGFFLSQRNKFYHILFYFQGKLPLTGIKVNRVEDTDTIKHAFEVSGPLIEKIVAVCQGPNEANKWVDLLSASPKVSRNHGNELKRNVSTSAVNIPQPPPHVSNFFLLFDLKYIFAL